MIYYQIGAAAIVLIFILIGAFRGIIRTLLNLIGLALNGFLSYFIAEPLAQGLYDSFFRQALTERIREAIAQNGMSLAVDSAVSAMPDWLANAVGLSEKLSGQNLEQLAKGVVLSDDQTLAMAQAVERVLAPVAVALLTIITVFVLFTLIMIIIKIIIRLIIKALDSPVLRTADRVLGAIVGGVEGAVIVLFLCALLNINLFA